MANLITEKAYIESSSYFDCNKDIATSYYISRNKPLERPYNLADSASLSHHKVVFGPSQCNPKFPNAGSIVGDNAVRGLRAVELSAPEAN